MAATHMHGFEAVRHYLENESVPFEVVEHTETTSAAADARASGVDLREAAKTLALRDNIGYRLAVVPSNRRLDEARVRAVLGASRQLRLATEEEMARDLPMFEVGALPPFGPMLPAPEIVDVRLLYHERVLCAAGDHRHSVMLDPRDLLRLAEPRVADICVHPETASRFHDLPAPY